MSNLRQNHNQRNKIPIQSTSQNTSQLQFRNIKYLVFHAVVLIKTFPFVYQLGTKIRLILMKLE